MCTKRIETNQRDICAKFWKSPDDLKKILWLASKRDASASLTLLHMESEGFSLTRSNFRLSICLKYGLTSDDMPVK